MSSSDNDWKSLIPYCLSPDGMGFARDAANYINARTMVDQARAAGASDAEIFSAIKKYLGRILVDPSQVGKEVGYAQQILGLNVPNIQ